MTSQIATKLGISAGSLALSTGLAISVGAITWSFANNARGWVDSFKKWWSETSVGSTSIGYDEAGNQIEIHFPLKVALSKTFDFEETKQVIEDVKKKFADAWNAPMGKDGVFTEEIGGNIIRGILEGMSVPDIAIHEPINVFYEAVGNALKDVFGIHSPAKNMEPYGKNILLGVVKGFSDSESEFAAAISNWWENSVKPWFTKDKWNGLGENAKSSILGKFDSMDTEWKTKISDWWENDVSAWFQADDWNTLASVIGGNITLSDTVSQWQTDISSWWDNNVSPWFTQEKWQGVSDTISGNVNLSNSASQWKTDISTWWKDDVEKWFTEKKWKDTLKSVPSAFKSAFKDAANGAIEMLNNVIGGVESMINRAVSGLNSMIDSISKIPGVSISKLSTISLPRIPQFAVGGFPEDGLFMANHTELVGQFSNGKTAVANNEMIVAGIEEAAYRGFARAYAENSREAELLQELIYAVREGKEIAIDGRSLVKVYDTRKAQNGFSFT